MLSVDQALSILKSNTPLFVHSETAPVHSSLNRVLEKDISARHDTPAFDNSAMDGFVLIKSDWEKGKRTFLIAGEIRPEDSAPALIPDGSCFRIMTGARVPENGNLVIPVELSNESNRNVTFSGLTEVNPIRRKGEGYKSGKTVLSAGTVIREQEMGLMIESGNTECSVFKKVRISVQVTGSELDSLKNTNGPVISSMASRWPGVNVKEWPVLGDSYDEVLKRLQELKKESDLIITTGGISAGKHDYLLQALQELGANGLIRKVSQKPGKPFTFHIWDGIPVCNLPGNPVSAVFTAELYARNVLYKMLPIQENEFRAILNSDVNVRGMRTVFSPGEIHIRDGRLFVNTDGSMKSHLLQLLNKQQCFVRLEPDTDYKKGDLVDIVPFSSTALSQL